MGSRQGQGVPMLPLVVSMVFGTLVVAPLLVSGFVAPIMLVVAFVAVVAGLLGVRWLHTLSTAKAASIIGVRGAKFAEAVSSLDLLCPGCGYDLTGVSTDRCPECGVDLELVVREQIDLGRAVLDGPGVSERDMRGIEPATARVLGLAVMLPALVAPSAVIVHKAVASHDPAIFSIGCLLFMVGSAWHWLRKRFEQDLPRQRTEALLSMGLVSGFIVIVSLIDLAY